MKNENVRKEKGRYHYTECGLENVYLANGFTVRKSDNGNVTSFYDIDGLHSLIGKSIAKAGGPMTPAEFRFLRLELDLSQGVLADLLGTEEQNVYRWENGKNKIPGPAQNLLALLYLESTDEESGIRKSLERISQLDAEVHRRVCLQWSDGWKSSDELAA